MLCIMWSASSSSATCCSFLILALITFTVNGQNNQTLSSIETSPWQLVADPPKLERITERSPYTINLTLTYNGEHGDSSPKYVTSPQAFRFVVKVLMSNRQTVAFSKKQEIEFEWDDIVDANVSSKTLEITGQVIGYVSLDFVLDILPAKPLQRNDTIAFESVPVLSGYLVTVVRASDTLDTVFTIIMVIMAALNLINMGCALDMAIVKQSIIRPVGVIVGFISQFTFMPLVAFGVAMLIIPDSLMGFGLLVIGVCPGGIASNFWTLLLDGDVNLSITMTFVSSLAAMGMMPLWLWLLSGFFLPEGSSVQVPYVNMAISLILLTFPLGIGILIRRFKLPLAEFLTGKILKKFSIFFIIFIFALGFYSMSHIFILMDWILLAAGLAVTVSGFLFGAIFAWITRLNRPQIIAVSLETAMQNANIAFVLLKTTLPTPYSDIAALPAIAQIIMTTSILFIFLGINFSYKCYQKNCTEKEKVKEEIETISSSGYRNKGYCADHDTTVVNPL
ncbi:ileal sodium/bile acid cotransporter-like [Daphnia carinata]|uniref:ileal sodium/bile acid cotransporter-like n=1 Tax=Daphnia carinata TaxID=120202 RepID=UPI00257D8F49|nr:ileal sodium/bile acid cotransporter-like [Daphnia carinata]XP_059352158.1 ileal sodium/bile acid cotransporter-like [Daphnia carinata]